MSVPSAATLSAWVCPRVNSAEPWVLRRHAHFDRDLADLVLGAAVGALLVHRDALADDRLLELVERELRRGAPLPGGH